jgi:6-phosphogluconolactonase
MDSRSGALQYVSKAMGTRDPSYLALHPQNTHLYAVNEIDDFEGKESGSVTAYAINQSTGELTELNQKATGGTWPCHITVDQTGKFALAVNYLSGSVVVLPIQSDGSLGDATDFIQHEGSSVNPDRQAGPHAHSVNLDSTNRRAYVADLGIDKMMIYLLDLANGKLTPNAIPSVSVNAGLGPRHFDLHPGGRYAYLIEELGSAITAFAYDESTGGLEEIETISTLPKGFDGRNTCADIHVSPSGKFVYGSNRGHDSIAIFEVDESTGRLTPVGHESTQGNTPRNFCIDPTGAFMYAANQNTDSIVTFRIDQLSGGLTPTGDVVRDVPMPVCIKFMPVMA